MKALALIISGWLVAGLAGTAVAQVVSDFEGGADGWRTANLNTPNLAPTGSFGSVIPIGPDTWSAFIVAEETGSSDWWLAFGAPAKFLGDQSATYGGKLSFDLGSDWNDGVAYPLAVLYGGGNTLVAHSGPPATVFFSHFDLSLTPGAWKFNNAAAADATQMMGVLSDLQGLFISADWHTGNDWSRIDNVVLAAVPEPAAYMSVFALGLGGLAAHRRSRRQSVGGVRRRFE